MGDLKVLLQERGAPRTAHSRAAPWPCGLWPLAARFQAVRGHGYAGARRWPRTTAPSDLSRLAEFFPGSLESNGSRRFWRNGDVEATLCAAAAGAMSLWLVSSCSHVLRRAECVLGACRRSTGRKVTIRGWRLPDKRTPLARVRTRHHVRFITHAQQQG